jgi:hypothetical protein
MYRRDFLAASAAALLLSGCDLGEKPPPTSVAAPVDESKLRELKVLLVDDALFGELLTRDWKSTSQRPFSVINITADELLGMKELAADVVIYPPALLGELAESGRIAPLDDATLAKRELAREDIIDLARVKLGNWGQRVFGIALSAPHFMVVYRSDLVAAIPPTWREFDEMCKSAPGDAPAALDPLHKESRSLVLLSRAVSRARGKNQHSTLFDVTTMKALIDQPPFVQALEEIGARCKDREEEALSTTPAMVWEQLATGKASIGITWPAPIKSETAKVDALRFSVLPGDDDYYSMSEHAWKKDDQVRRYPVLGGGGRIVSAIRGKLGLREGANLLVLLSGKARADSLGAACKDALPIRKSQLTRAGRFLGVGSEETATQFAEAVVDSLTADDYLFALNLPSADRYRAALDEAIEQAIRGTKPAQECLHGAAQKWDTVTNEIGLEKQRLAYLRSLGLESIG